MARFRRKPVVVEAVQWFSPGDHPAVGHNQMIKTLEGDMRVSPGDWVVTGVEGEHYPVKPSIFSKIYESVDLAETLDLSPDLSPCPIFHHRYDIEDLVVTKKRHRHGTLMYGSANGTSNGDEPEAA